MRYQANKLDKFRLVTEKLIVMSMLPFTAEKNIFCHTKLQTIVIKVVLSKFLQCIFDSKLDILAKIYLKEAVAILISPLKLLITSSYNGQQLAFLENQIIF